MSNRICTNINTLGSPCHDTIGQRSSCRKSHDLQSTTLVWEYKGRILRTPTKRKWRNIPLLGSIHIFYRRIKWCHIKRIWDISYQYQ